MAWCFLDSSQLAALERCLSVVCKAANWLPDGGIFWIGKSIFAANRNAAVGLADSGLDFEPQECIALSAGAMRKVVSALRSVGVRFIESMEVSTEEDGVVNIALHYEKGCGFENRTIVSLYLIPWRPDAGIEERYSLLRSHGDYYDYELNVEKMLCKTRCQNDVMMPIESLIPVKLNRKVGIDLAVLKSFLAPARSEDTTMLLSYSGPELPILARAGDIIGILDIVAEDRS
jgi:hypothetical protein